MRYGMGLRPSPTQSMVIISSTLAPLNKRLCKILPGRCFFDIFYPILWDVAGTALRMSSVI